MPEVCDVLRQLPRKGELVFHTRDGLPWKNNVQSQFRKIVSRAGIKYCTIHDLRRTFVSHLAMAGVNEAVVQKLAGHASITTTLKYYTDIAPESLKAAQEQLPFRKMLGDVSYPTRGTSVSRERETARVINLSRAAS